MEAVREKLLNRFRVSGTGCYEFQGCLNKPNGYGILIFDRQRFYVHRLSYELYKGTIPDNMQVCHTCDNRRCIRPSHLFLGSNKDNSDDMMKKKRNKITGAKVSAAEVLEIRKDIRPLAQIAKSYGISRSQVINIRQKHVWKDIN